MIEKRYADGKLTTNQKIELLKSLKIKRDFLKKEKRITKTTRRKVVDNL